MNGQVIRRPGRLILGGYDTHVGSSRYLHLGPFAFSVNHEWDGRWRFRFSQYLGYRRWSVEVRA